MSTTARRVVAIVNPVSGRGNAGPLLRAVEQDLRRAGASLAVEVTREAGHGAELARQVAPHVDALLIAGGDGTVSEVVNGLAGHRVPLLILGSGTENLLAKQFGMPTDPARVAAALLYGTPTLTDVGSVNERRFLAVVGVGFDAEVVQRLARVRRGHIDYFEYFWPIWRTFWAHRFPWLRVEMEGACVFEGRGLAIVGIIPRYSLGLRILQHARHDDGLLDVCVFPCASRGQLCIHALNVALRRHTKHAGVVYRQCRSVSITSPDRVPVEVDGDAAGYLPVRCSVVPEAVTLLHC
ncbi:MAG TPA: diacylglycerol kinase family lipid kinase [Phycisphaerae bacterium]|nr:diacylglycerol kinase family lipid kinase [Phycisphaerae bacterium]HNU46348.1 diacylglycerol kinase family lipid kinase [Phycisphaerae bacterium]